MDFTNRLTANSRQSEGSFFFEFDYWTYDEGSEPVELNGDLYMAVRSVTDGAAMSQKTLRRLYGLS